jgi:AbrB family looped-hinge helix DNA binding protein
MDICVVGANGRILLPAKIRRRFKIKEGMTIAFIEQNDKLVILPLHARYFKDLAGIVGTKGKILGSLLHDKKRDRGC